MGEYRRNLPRRQGRGKTESDILGNRQQLSPRPGRRCRPQPPRATHQPEDGRDRQEQREQQHGCGHPQPGGQRLRRRSSRRPRITRLIRPPILPGGRSSALGGKRRGLRRGNRGGDAGDGQVGIARHGTTAGGRLERHPADPVEVELRPGVEIVGGDSVDAVALDIRIEGASLLEADGHPGRDSQAARHHRHGRSEVDAIAALRGEELRDDVHPGAVIAVVDRGALRIRECTPAEILLQGDGLGIIARLVHRDRARGTRNDRREIVREAQEFAEATRNHNAGRRKLFRGRTRNDAPHLVVLSQDRLARAGHGEAARLPIPVPRQPADL